MSNANNGASLSLQRVQCTCVHRIQRTSDRRSSCFVKPEYKYCSYYILGVIKTANIKERKGKEEYLYSAFLHQGTHKALRYGSHIFTCKQHHACLSFVSVHLMAPPQQLRQQTSNCSLLLTYRPRKDERLSWPGWLTCSGWFTHVSGHPSSTGRAQDSESPPAKDRRYTAGARNQPTNQVLIKSEDVSSNIICYF